MTVALDAAQTAFFTLGSVAIIVGAALGIRRFGVERPNHSAWEVTLEHGTRRRILWQGNEQFVHSFLLILRNQSFAAQRVDGYWFALFPSFQDDFSGKRFDGTPPTVDGLRGFFGRGMTVVGTTVAPDRTIRFGQTMIVPTAHAAVRVCYAVVGRRPRLIRSGFHNEAIVAAGGSQIVPIRLEDVLADGCDAHS